MVPVTLFGQQFSANDFWKFEQVSLTMARFVCQSLFDRRTGELDTFSADFPLETLETALKEFQKADKVVIEEGSYRLELHRTSLEVTLHAYCREKGIFLVDVQIPDTALATLKQVRGVA